MKIQNLKCLWAVGMMALIGVNAHAYSINVAPSGDIQSAINSVSAAGGGTVNITSGTGTISTALSVPSKVTIDGAGNPTTTLDLSSSIDNGILSQTTAWTDITVENIKIQGAGTSVAQNGIVLNDPGSGDNTSGKVSNVQVLNCGDDGCQLSGDDSSITSCNFHNNGSGTEELLHNLYFLGGSSTVISGCTLNSSPGGSGLHVNNWVAISGGESENNTTSSNGQRGHSFTASTSNTYDDYTINTCTADDNGAIATDGGYGFSLASGSGTIENCTATGNVTGGYNLTSAWTSKNNN